MPFLPKDKHWNWKGDGGSYNAMHLWVKKTFGKPQTCEFADETCSKTYEWATKNHDKGGRSREDWLRLCKSHHERYDKDLKLSTIQVNQIRAEYIPRIVSYRMLARKYGVSGMHIYSIIHNKKRVMK